MTSIEQRVHEGIIILLLVAIATTHFRRPLCEGFVPGVYATSTSYPADATSTRIPCATAESNIESVLVADVYAHLYRKIKQAYDEVLHEADGLTNTFFTAQKTSTDGRIDAFVNGAVTTVSAPLRDDAETVWERALGTEYLTVFGWNGRQYCFRRGDWKLKGDDSFRLWESISTGPYKARVFTTYNFTGSYQSMGPGKCTTLDDAYFKKVKSIKVRFAHEDDAAWDVSVSPNTP